MENSIHSFPKLLNKTPDQTTSNRIQVLVVDDSAIVREMMKAILSQDQQMVISVAADPIIAMDKMKAQKPDVIVLDLEMPRMDGLTFLRKIMSECPLPVVICSSLVGSSTETALRAMEEGAVEVVAKPKMGVRGFIEDSATTLINTIRAAALARSSKVVIPALKQPLISPQVSVTRSALKITTDKVIAIGASTGGTEALRVFLEAMPPDAPGIVIVQHMPEAFTAALANRLNKSCQIEVKEAVNGDNVIDGRALIAPGNRHLILERNGGHYSVKVAYGPLVSHHRPSVNVLFRSVAQAAGPNAIGVIMTGMGDDGAVGMKEMKQAGAATIAQDEASCVVFGMPKEAILRGGVDDVMTLSQIPAAVLRKAQLHR